MSRRAFLTALAAMALVAALVVGLSQSQESSAPDPLATAALDPAEARERLAGAPAPLAALHARANRILPGGGPTLDRELKALEGHPVVLNVWAAWCGPCRDELPVFQQVSLDRGKEVAFIGVDTRDDRAAAQRLLARIPQTYPSVEDGDGKVFERFGAAGVPTTVFYDASGKQTFVHQGPYLEREDLEADIDRYATGA